MKKILIVEDDKRYASLISDTLIDNEYEVRIAYDGEQGIEKFFSDEKFDLVILDVMMPEYDGFEVLRVIRERSDVPVIMLTALGDEFNEVRGLELGADDYIEKPFKRNAFLSRVKNKLRTAKKYEYNTLKINFDAEKVTLENKKITLSSKEYHLLIYMINNKNIVLSRDKILDSVWGYNYSHGNRTVDTHIKTLRSKLQSYSQNIVSVRGKGYMWVEDEK